MSPQQRNTVGFRVETSARSTVVGVSKVPQNAFSDVVDSRNVSGVFVLVGVVLR